MTIMSKEKRFKISIIILAFGLLFESIILLYHATFQGFFYSPRLRFFIPITPELTYIVAALPFTISIVNIFLTILCMIFAFQMRKDQENSEMARFIKYFIVGSSLTIFFPFFKTSASEFLFWNAIGGEEELRMAQIIASSIWVSKLVVYSISFLILSISWKNYAISNQNDPKIHKQGSFLKINYIIAMALIPISIVSTSIILYYNVIQDIEVPYILSMIFSVPATFTFVVIHLLTALGYFFVGFSNTQNYTTRTIPKVPKLEAS